MRISDYLIFDSGFNRSNQGFTLVETLVVLFIITILAGLTAARLPGFAGSADMDTEARRLELLLNMARTEAIMDSAEYGFQRTSDGYEFLKYDDGSQDWLAAESPFHGRVVDDVQLTLRAEKAGFGTLGEDLPPVLILSSGETTPFRIEFESSSGEFRTLVADGYGEFKWASDEQ